jgi:uncharacterized membrane protein
LSKEKKMTVGLHKRAVGVFSTAREAEDALKELRDAGFPMGHVSVIAKDADRMSGVGDTDVRDAHGNQAGEGATAGAVTGGALGGLTGLLVGLGALAIPGIGPVMLAGATATALATTASGAAIGAAAGGLLGALVGLGIPEDRARVYNDRVSRGEYLVMVDGTEDEIRHAEAVLSRRGIQEWGIYDAPGTAATGGTGYTTAATTATTTGTDHSTSTVHPHANVTGGTGDREIVTIVDRREPGT